MHTLHVVQNIFKTLKHKKSTNTLFNKCLYFFVMPSSFDLYIHTLLSLPPSSPSFPLSLLPSSSLRSHSSYSSSSSSSNSDSSSSSSSTSSNSDSEAEGARSKKKGRKLSGDTCLLKISGLASRPGESPFVERPVFDESSQDVCWPICRVFFHCLSASLSFYMESKRVFQSLTLDPPIS